MASSKDFEEKKFSILNNPLDNVYLFSILLFSLGSSIITPYFGIYVAVTLGYGLKFAGILISVKVISQRGMSLPGGIFTDCYGSRTVALAGIALRSLSFGLLLIDPSYLSLIASAFLNGTGSALYQPAVRKLIFSRHREDSSHLGHLVGMRNAFLNIGAATGPAIGLLLVESNFKIAILFITIIYIVNGALIAIIPKEFSNKQTDFSEKPKWRDLRSKDFYYILLIQFSFFLAYSHFEFLIPIFIQQQFGRTLIAVAFLVNTIMIVMLQLKWGRKFSKVPCWVGNGCFVSFYLCCIVASSVDRLFWDANLLSATLLVIITMALFTLGEIILSNRVDFLTALKVSPRTSGTAYGVVALSGALAIFLANMVNSYILEFSNYKTLWLLNSIISIIFSVILFLSGKQNENR